MNKNIVKWHNSEMDPYCKHFAGCNHSVMHSAGRTEPVRMRCSPEGGRQQVGLAEVAVHSCSAAAHILAAEPGTHPEAENNLQAGNRHLGCRQAGCLHYSCRTKIYVITNFWKNMYTLTFSDSTYKFFSTKIKINAILWNLLFIRKINSVQNHKCFR